MILQLLCLILLFCLGREVFGSKAAIIACAIDAFYLPEIVSQGFVLTEIEF
jgi:4-amino-4-deoxy-L-arabinose transferase-like glycosyltransferase